MAEFPPKPISPQEFIEQYIPKAFAEAELPDELKQAEAKLGILLQGDGGGRWLMRLDQGSLAIDSGTHDGASMTIVQSVDDWRGALWEGRGGAIGKQATAIFRPGEQAQSAAGVAGAGAPSLASLKQLEALDGLLRMVVTGGDGGDWAVGMKLGSGDVPEEATCTVTVTAEDAAAMESGELDPMQAFMSGRIQIAGDMTLMMQMQAIQMQAAAAAQSSS